MKSILKCLISNIWYFTKAYLLIWDVTVFSGKTVLRGVCLKLNIFLFFYSAIYIHITFSCAFFLVLFDLSYNWLLDTPCVPRRASVSLSVSHSMPFIINISTTRASVFSNQFSCLPLASLWQYLWIIRTRWTTWSFPCHTRILVS